MKNKLLHKKVTKIMTYVWRKDWDVGSPAYKYWLHRLKKENHHLKTWKKIAKETAKEEQYE